MIVCASRRTDIPAFHSEWFMGRLRSGHALVRNPVADNVVYDVSLRRQDVDCLYFMSKDPRPMEKHLAEISDMGYEMLFHITINPYGDEMEPNVPDVKDIMDSFCRISSLIGSGRMIWRYDPVIFSERYDISFHEEAFERICSGLEGYTGRCVFSFLSEYEKLAHQYSSKMLRRVSEDEMRSFCSSIPKIAGRHSIKVTSCCIDRDLSGYGIERKACLDADHLRSLNIPFDEKNVPTRKDCLCLKSIDIGMYDTCRHDCLYCYANSADGRKRRVMSFDPGNEMLFGSVSDKDRIIRIGYRSNTRLSDW